MKIIYDYNEINFDFFSTDLFNYGAGLFETIKVINGKAIFFEEHLLRMQKSIADLGFGVSLNFEKISESARFVIERDSISLGSLKINFFKIEEGSFFLIRCFEKKYDKKLYSDGVELKISSLRKNEHSQICYHKTNNYMENIIEKREAEKEGFFDSLFFNTSGFLAETTVANIFFIKDGRFYTPHEKAGILPGIIRGKVIEIIKKDNFIEEGFFTKKIIEESQGAFITNSLMGIMPVKKIGEREFDSGNKETLFLMKEYEDVLHLYAGM